MLKKIITLCVLLTGEAFGIGAEILGARMYGVGNQSFLKTFFWMAPIFFVGMLFLLSGYMLGYRVFKNIWVVSAISIGSILVIEPIINILLFHQPPTRGSLLGFAFGIAGIVASLFF